MDARLYFWLFLAVGVAGIWGYVASKRESNRAKELQDRNIEEKKDKLEEETKNFREETDLAVKKIRDNIDNLKKLKDRTASEIRTRQIALSKLVEEKTEGFPFLAQAYADFIHLQDETKAWHLENKKHPARKAAEEVREIAANRRKAEKAYRVLKNKLDLYEKLFPWLVEFCEEATDDLLVSVFDETTEKIETEQHDPATRYLSHAEFESLNSAEKYQRALDRYRKSKKSSWQIGRDYERYIGYLYEREGHKVKYFGAIEGLDDLGRDLLVSKNGKTQVIQCKYWAKEKMIREKHIFQIFGTTVEYILKNSGHDLFSDISLDNLSGRMKFVMPVFITSTILSDVAKEMAALLGVRYREGVAMIEYPMIKCNISKRDGTRIYHLPFDQQYDRIDIEWELGEFYAQTVFEAELAGFRRAWRWRPEGDS